MGPRRQRDGSDEPPSPPVAGAPRRAVPDVEPASPILAAAAIVVAGFMASKLVGLVRNVVISHQYGASREYEMFLAAISLPDTVFQVLAGGAVSAAFIPVFTSYLSRGDYERAWRLTSALINLAVLGMGAVAVLLALGAPLAMSVLVPGWSPEEQQRTAHLTRMMLVSPVIFAVSALLTSALNALKRFALAMAAPLMYNLALIGAAVLLRPLGAEGLAIGAVAGALLHLGVQVPGLARVGMRYSASLGLDLSGTGEVARLMLPRTVGLGASQLNQLVSVALASFLVAGSIAYLNYAWLILMVPLGVFAMGLSTAAFPTLAEQSAGSRTEEQRQTFLFGLRLILFLTVPAAVALLVLGRPIVALLLERGAFEASNTLSTAFALGLFAVGLPGHAAIEIVDRVFYAERDTATPVRVAVGAIAANIALSIGLMHTPLSFGGLALANSLSAVGEASCLALVLQRRMGWMRRAELVAFGWRVGLAALTLGAVAIVVQGAIAPYIDSAHWAAEAVLLLAAGVPAVAAYVLGCQLLGVDDGKRALALLRRRSSRTEPKPGGAAAG